MQLAKIQLARSIWLFDTAELNPFGINLSHFIAAFVERYSFRQAPKAEGFPLGANSMRFDNGTFLHEGALFDVGLEIFADGITADSRSSTVVCDAFLADAIKWATSSLEVALSPTIGKKRMYRSEVIFYADASLTGISPILDGISEELGNELGISTELTAISVGAEGRHTLFSIERVANAPFSELKFYSWALLQTHAHIALMNKFTTSADETRKRLAQGKDATDS